jgi:ATP/maltotriose-dependent transcriptional regulator MalT/DNA-binding SARP family transcriptional activator
MALRNPDAPITRKSTIDRPRLIEQLELAANYSLTLVTGPPGYGKTTLAAQFARQTSYSVVWHTVEERERDVPNLNAHCINTLADVIPDIHELAAHGGSTPGESAALIAERLRAAPLDVLVYVLDDAHHLVGSPNAEAWLRSFIALLPASCHLILITRVIPKLPLVEMVARQEVLTLGQEQLRFTSKEIRALADKMGIDLTDAELENIAARLDGWPAGTILALQPLPSDLEQALFQGGSGPEALFDALAELMVNAQPPPLRNFLLASSTLTRITPDLCQTALQLPDSLEHVTEALQRNLFLSEIRGGLVYHPLFRDFLQRQLQQRDHALYTALHRRAGRWFEDNNQLEDAFEHYLAAEQYEAATAIAERAAHAYFAQGKVETLLHWAARLRPVGVSIPRLLYTCAMAHTDRYDYEQAHAALEEAAKGFQANEDRTGLIQIELLRATIENQQGQYQDAVPRAERLAAQETTPSNLRGHALYTLGVGLLNLGDAETALHHLETALPLYRAYEDGYAISQLLQQLDVAYLRLGDFEKAAACLHEVVAICRSLGNSFGLAMALNNLGYHYHMLGNYEQAQHTFHDGLSVISHVPEKHAQSPLLWSLGELLRDRGRYEEAAQLYIKALEFMGDNEPALRSSMLTSFATLRRWQGKLSEAASLAAEAVSLAERYSLGLEKLQAQVAMWATRAKDGESRAAQAALEQLAFNFRAQRALIPLAQTWGLCASAALLHSDTDAARAYLKTACETITHPANLQPLIAEIAHGQELNTFVKRYKAAFPTLYAGLKCLKEAQIQPESQQKIEWAGIVPTYSLRVWCLGPERVERDATPVTSSDWQAVGARELFFYLLFKGPATREMISLAFWPDSHPRLVRSSFHTTLYRSRQAVGANVILFEDNLYFINPEVSLWCDAHELQALAQQARLLTSRSAYTENLWRQAVELYQGDFLPTVYSEWAVTIRTTLQETYLGALLGLGNTARARKEWHEAIATFQRALEVDPFREDIHRAIMICLAEQGEVKLLLQHFKDLKRLLLRELGVAPSTETLNLARKLLGGNYPPAASAGRW